MPLLNLDTHCLIDALSDDMAASQRAMLARYSWGMSSITLWELGKLSQLGRLSFSLSDPDFTLALGRILFWPVTREIAAACLRLDFQGDPADEIIAATSLVHDVPLLTRDRRILKSKIVPLAS